MEVKQKSSENKGWFYIEDNDKRIAVMTYIFNEEGVFTVEHTVVEPEYEGRGIGRLLVDAAVKYARENNYKIDPVCPYTKKVLESKNDFTDILYS